MTPLQLLAQVFGFISLVILVISLHQKKKSKLLVFQMVSNFSSAIQYFLLGGTSGGLTHLVCVFRNYLFHKYRRKKIVSTGLFFLIIFLLIALTAISYDGPVSLLPTLAILIYTFGLTFGSLKTIRIVDILTCFISIAYSLSIGAYVAILTSVLEIISAAHALYQLDRRPVARQKNC